MTEPVRDLETNVRLLHQLARKDDVVQTSKEFYQKWAEHYDEDVNEAFKVTGYGAPSLCAQALGNVLPNKSEPIVDCAAGTGRVGIQLAKCGFTRIDAIDFSQNLLDISASKGVYERLICDVLGKNKVKGVEDDYYSGLTCVGGLSTAHLSMRQDVFVEWNRIVKKGGFMVFNLSRLLFSDQMQEYKDSINEIEDAVKGLIQKGVWELVDKVQLDNFCCEQKADVYTVRRL